jgi:hypothetical protein
MSSLRRRLLGAPTQASREASPAKAEEVRLAPVSKIITDKHHKTRKRRNGFIFFLGGLFGIVAAGFFAGRNDLIEFPELSELSMDSLIDILPAGFVSDARDLAVSKLLFWGVWILGLTLWIVANEWEYRGERERPSTTILFKLDSTSRLKEFMPIIPS